MLLTESKSHGGAWRDARDIYEPAVKKLLERSLRPPSAAASKVEPPAKDPPKPVSERTSK